jgi:hypothetical protein
MTALGDYIASNYPRNNLLLFPPREHPRQVGAKDFVIKMEM